MKQINFQWKISKRINWTLHGTKKQNDVLASVIKQYCSTITHTCTVFVITKVFF